MSFLAPSDLTRRLVSIIHSRLHRIRPVWLYSDTSPTVMRDVDFDIAARVPFQELQWNDPQRNDYRLEGESGSRRREGGDVRNTAGHGRVPETCRNRSLASSHGTQGFRVLLMRVTPERTLFRALTVAFVVLLVVGPPASSGTRGAGDGGRPPPVAFHGR